MYTSGKRAELGMAPANHDPLPWQHEWDGEPSVRSANGKCAYCLPILSPSSWFDVPENPILVEFRRSSPWGWGAGGASKAAHLELLWLRTPDYPMPAGATPDQIEHAHRVLSKMAVLS